MSEAPTVERGRRQLDVGYYKFDLYTVLGGMKFYVEYARVTVQNGQEVWQMATGTLPGLPCGTEGQILDDHACRRGVRANHGDPGGRRLVEHHQGCPRDHVGSQRISSVFADCDKTKAISITKPSYGLSPSSGSPRVGGT